MNTRSKNIIYSIFLLIVVTTVWWWRQGSDKQQEISADKSGWVYLKGMAMGAAYAITYYDKNGTDYQKEIDSILDDFNACLSTYDPNSSISKLNQQDTFQIDCPYLYPVLLSAKEAFQVSEKDFDPTVLPLVKRWGFFSDKEPEELPSQKEVDSILRYVNFDSIIFDEKILIKKIHGQQLDFNANAPGYASDLIAEFLSENGVENYLVNLGTGEIVAKGINPDSAIWRLGIVKPDFSDASKEAQVIVSLENKAMATSGNYEKYYEKDGKKYAHTISPITGYPVQHTLLSATVLTDRCIDADALATIFMVKGLEKSMDLLSTLDNVQAYFIYSDAEGNYQTWYSPELDNYIIPVE